MSNRLDFAGFAAALAITLASTAVFAAPTTLSYVGELRAENGVLYSGAVGVTATLFDAAADGTAVWGPQDLGDVMVMNGLFDVVIGGDPAAPLGTALAANDNLWLEITVNGTALEPRQRLRAVPYAMVASNAERLGGVAADDLIDQAGSAFSGMAPPADPVVGELWLDTATDKLNIWFNGQWNLVSSSGLTEDELPNDSLDQVSNGVLANEFTGVAADWTGGPLGIADFDPASPNVTTVATIVSDESPDSQTFGIVVSTSFSLSALSTVRLTLTPPVGTGVDAFVLLEAQLSPGTYPNMWTIDTTPELEGLLGQTPGGQWTLTIQDIDDTLAGGSVGNLTGFGLSYDVLRANQVLVAGTMDVAGSIKVGQDTEACSAEKSGALRWSGTSLDVCNGARWSPLDAGAGTTEASAMMHCAGIKAAGGTAAESGSYWIHAGNPAEPFQTHCDMEVMGGGWTHVVTINPDDGSVVSFSNTDFWTSDNVTGAFGRHLAGDYKGPAAWRLAGTELLIEIVEPGMNGDIIGWKAWSMDEKTFDSFFDQPQNTVVTTGTIGANTSAVYAFEAVVRQGDQLIANKNINPNADRMRLSANNYPQQSDDNSAGLGTMMNQNNGVNTYRYRDVELWVNSSSNVWSSAPSYGRYKWIGNDGGCGGNCGSADASGGPPWNPHWSYRIFVR